MVETVRERMSWLKYTYVFMRYKLQRTVTQTRRSEKKRRNGEQPTSLLLEVARCFGSKAVAVAKPRLRQYYCALRWYRGNHQLNDEWRNAGCINRIDVLHTRTHTEWPNEKNQWFTPSFYGTATTFEFVALHVIAVFMNRPMPQIESGAAQLNVTIFNVSA